MHLIKKIKKQFHSFVLEISHDPNTIVPKINLS